MRPNTQPSARPPSTSTPISRPGPRCRWALSNSGGAMAGEEGVRHRDGATELRPSLCLIAREDLQLSDAFEEESSLLGRQLAVAGHELGLGRHGIAFGRRVFHRLHIAD